MTDTTDRTSAYAFLEANFAPVTEEVTVADLEVTGALPEALVGRYLRNGPNPVAADPAHHHWFIGDGMVHGVRLRDGRAEWYRNRWVRTPDLAAALGEEPAPTADGGLYPGQGNTNVVHHAGGIWAITEGALPWQLTPELDTIGQSRFGGSLPAGINAHPKFDPDTNDLHVVSYSFIEPVLRYHVISAAGQLTHTAEVAMGGPVMVHDMGLTDTRVVVFDLPVVFDLEVAMAGLALPFQWDPAYHARVGLLPRTGSGADVVWLDVDPCYVYHPLNAYDDGDRVVIDLVVHPRAFDDPKHGDPSQGEPVLERWVLDPVAGRIDRTVLDGRGQEFPRADERLAGRPHRYGYSLANSGFDALGGRGDDGRTALLKHDVVAGTTVEVDLGAGRAGSEFVFVPAADDAGEDEGWLLGYVYDKATDTSALVVVDAHDFGTEVARVHLPVRVPAGFHGNWVPDRALT